MQTRTTPLLIAASVLAALFVQVAAPPAQALGSAQDVLNATQTCPPGNIVPYIECVLQSTGVLDELWFVTWTESGAANFTTAYAQAQAGQVVFATGAFAGAQSGVTATLVSDTQGNKDQLVFYVNGVPAVVGTFTVDAVKGECAFWLGPHVTCIPSPGPVLAAPGSTSVPAPPQPPQPPQCDPSAGMIPYVECVAEYVVLATTYHELAVAGGAATFTLTLVASAQTEANRFTGAETTIAGAFASGTGSNAGAYANALAAAGLTAPGAVLHVYGVECELLGTGVLPCHPVFST